MSFKFNNAVQRLQPLSNKDTRLIIWYLADHASDAGVAYASYPKLMSRCQIKSRTTINNSLTELESLGILKKKKRPNQCLKFILNLDVINKLGLIEVNSEESELNGSTLGNTSDSTSDDTTEETPSVRGAIFSGVSRDTSGSTSGDTLSTCLLPLEINPPVLSQSINPFVAVSTEKEKPDGWDDDEWNGLSDNMKLFWKAQLSSDDLTRNARGTLSSITEIFSDDWNPSCERYLPEIKRLCAAETDPVVFFNKISLFIEWMTGKGLIDRIASVPDFLHHWENRSGSDKGLRPQFEAFYRSSDKSVDMKKFRKTTARVKKMNEGNLDGDEMVTIKDVQVDEL